MNRDLAVKNISELTRAQLASLRELKVSEHQEVLGKSFAESIEDWKLARPNQALGLCFLFEDQPVGLILFNRSTKSSKAEPAQTASIHGLKIATPWQRRGWGHLAFRLAVDQLKVVWPEIRMLKLAVDAENTAAIKVYQAFGMRDSGPVFQGSTGQEHRMEVSLRS